MSAAEQLSFGSHEAQSPASFPKCAIVDTKDDGNPQNPDSWGTYHVDPDEERDAYPEQGMAPMRRGRESASGAARRDAIGAKHDINSFPPFARVAPTNAAATLTEPPPLDNHMQHSCNVPDGTMARRDNGCALR